MTEEGRRRNLGRGLSALFRESAETGEAPGERAARLVPIEQLRPGPFQPRRNFDRETLEALAQSVREKGILQPILVRPVAGGVDSYEIIAGERRWRAAQMAKLHIVPVVVHDFSDREVLEVALVENIQRRDLSPLEEAEGYRRLMAEFSHTQEDLARAVGKSRSHIANMLRLLGLPEAVRQLLEAGKLSAGHARALLNAEGAEALALEVVRRDLNVRQTEQLVQAGKARPPASAAQRPKDADTRALERRLGESLGLKVTIDWNGSRGALAVQYASLEQLDEVVRRLSQER